MSASLSSAAAVPAAEQAFVARTDQAEQPSSAPGTPPCLAGALESLCLIARWHQVAAEPPALAHQLALPGGQARHTTDLLQAARHLGLKAKLVRSSAQRLQHTPLPAIALVRHASGEVRCVVLAQCDGQRVLTQDLTAPGQSNQLGIAPLDTFAQAWTGELILVASRASLAGELARFDFSWFIPSLVKHRSLLGEVLLVSCFLQLFARRQ